MVSKDPKEWVARLESPGTSLLAPFTSEATRKAGRQLVFLSALTILLSKSIITIGEGTFAGLKFQPSKIAAMVLLAGLACTYFLLLYAFDLYQDWKATQYKRIPALVEYRRLYDETRQEQNARMERWSFLETETERLRQLRRDKYEEYFGVNQVSQPSIDAENELEPDMEAIDRSHQDSLKMDEFSEYCRNDELEKLTNEYLTLALDETLNARFEALLAMVETTYHVDKLRLVTDVVFPLGLGLFAVISAVWNFFAKGVG